MYLLLQMHVGQLLKIRTLNVCISSREHLFIKESHNELDDSVDNDRVDISGIISILMSTWWTFT